MSHHCRSAGPPAWSVDRRRMGSPNQPRPRRLFSSAAELSMFGEPKSYSGNVWATVRWPMRMAAFAATSSGTPIYSQVGKCTTTDAFVEPDARPQEAQCDSQAIGLRFSPASPEGPVDRPGLGSKVLGSTWPKWVHRRRRGRARVAVMATLPRASTGPRGAPPAGVRCACGGVLNTLCGTVVVSLPEAHAPPPPSTLCHGR
jgi:hypothetical protein